MYTALYRRLRPKTFEDVIGQEHIVRTLTNSVKNGRISHAYLFCGTRGTGKTSTAKVFARAINCLTPNNGEPCNTCASCSAVLENRSLSVVEIDAASNNGVDNIRDLREEVKYPPTDARYKVYIVDEVHMLSAGAFNALLKTLEEPPAFVVFILCTTDPQKLPATILSRCQRFDFRRITSADMVQTLKEYMQDKSVSEGVTITDEALSYIAFVSDGAMRDALSILDRCISLYAAEDITLEMVHRLLGTADTSVLFDYTDALAKRDGASALRIISELIANGRDVSAFVADLLQHLRNLLVVKLLSDTDASGGTSGALDLSPERIEKLRNFAAHIPSDTLISYINTFSMLQNQLRYAQNPRIMFEVTTLKICTGMTDALSDLTKRIEALESGVGMVVASAAGSATTAAPAVKTAAQTPAAARKTSSATSSITAATTASASIKVATGTSEPAAAPAPTTPTTPSGEVQQWTQIISKLRNPLKTMLMDSIAVYTGTDTITISTRPASLKYAKDHAADVQAVITEAMGQPQGGTVYNLVFRSIDGQEMPRRNVPTVGRFD